MSTIKEVRNAIRKGRLQTAIGLLSNETEVESTDLLDEVDLLSGQFQQWKRAKRLGLSAPEETRNRIAEALLYITQELNQRKAFQSELHLEKILASSSLDLGKLQEYLSKQQFDLADIQTEEIFIGLGSKDEGLSFDELANLPCDALQAIDALWSYYSQGKFGLSVQLRQLLEAQYVENRFGEATGWRKNGLWIAYSELNFSLLAPKGHLPAIGKTGGVAFFSASSLGKGIPGFFEGQFEVMRSGISDLFNPGGLGRFGERVAREFGYKGGNGFALWWVKSRIPILNRWKNCNPVQGNTKISSYESTS